MSRFHSYINTAKKLVETYTGEIPFGIFLKQFFSTNKKYGAKDRRQISSLCYDYFRLGFAAKSISMEEKMLLGKFICEQEGSELMAQLRPGWNEQATLTPEEKLKAVKDVFSVTDIFPLARELSSDVDIDAFCKSFLVQPDVFVRIRPYTRVTALKKLERIKVPYQMLENDCVQLPSGTRLEDYFIIDKEVVVQDYNSQRVLNFLRDEQVQTGLNGSQSKAGASIWDCCAASGGKSILVSDIFNKKLDLTVSDIRASIVLNLHQRFIKAGIKQYKYFISDVSEPDFAGIGSGFDVIICDAPCSGSGTWSRTPEQLVYFKKDTMQDYQALQKRIVTHVFPRLRSGGLFFYITCSVFKKENEETAQFIQESFGCEMLHQELLIGYHKKADTMFVSVFRK